MVDDSRRLENDLRRRELTFIVTVALASLGVLEFLCWKVGKDTLSQRLAICQGEVEAVYRELREAAQ